MELHVSDPSDLASSLFGTATLGQSKLSQTLKLSGNSSFGGWRTTPLINRQLAPLLSGKISFLYLKCALFSISLQAILPASLLPTAMRSTPATELMDFKWSIPFCTVMPVTGQSGNAFARASTPAYTHGEKIETVVGEPNTTASKTMEG